MTNSATIESTLRKGETYSGAEIAGCGDHAGHAGLRYDGISNGWRQFRCSCETNLYVPCEATR